MIYLFLDFDGVLHTHSGKRFSLVENFAKVLKKFPEVKIVFSTSWREYSTVEFLSSYLPEELHSQCVGMTPWFKESMKYPRYNEIQHYLKENNITEDWLAVDDLASLFPPDCPNLFLVNGREGITKETAKVLQKTIKDMLAQANKKTKLKS